MAAKRSLIDQFKASLKQDDLRVGAPGFDPPLHDQLSRRYNKALDDKHTWIKANFDSADSAFFDERQARGENNAMPGKCYKC